MSDYDLTATGGRFLAPEPCFKCGSSGHLAEYCNASPHGNPVRSVAAVPPIPAAATEHKETP